MISWKPCDYLLAFTSFDVLAHNIGAAISQYGSGFSLHLSGVHCSYGLLRYSHSEIGLVFAWINEAVGAI